MGTKTEVASTKGHVTDATCTTVRDLISAGLDGELTTAEEHALESHLPLCAACQHYQQDAFGLRRALRMRIVEPNAVSAPDSDPTPEPIAAMVGSLRGLVFLRWSLFVIGGTLVLINVQSLLWTEAGAAAHLNRHDAVFGTALGIGMLAVALKPQRAIGLVPLTTALAVLMLIVAGADLATGNANLLSEAIHIVQFGGLVCLWVISGGPSRLSRYRETISTTLRLRPTGSVPGWPTA